MVSNFRKRNDCVEFWERTVMVSNFRKGLGLSWTCAAVLDFGVGHELFRISARSRCRLQFLPRAHMVFNFSRGQ